MRINEKGIDTHCAVVRIADQTPVNVNTLHHRACCNRRRCRRCWREEKGKGEDGEDGSRGVEWQADRLLSAQSGTGYIIL